MTVTEIRPDLTAVPESQDPRVLRAMLNNADYAPWHEQIQQSLDELERRVGYVARFGLTA